MLDNLNFKEVELIDGPNTFRFTSEEVVDYAYDLVIGNKFDVEKGINIIPDDVKPHYKSLENMNKVFNFFDIEFDNLILL